VRRHAGIGSPGSIRQPVRAQQRSGSVMREAKESRQLAKADASQLPKAEVRRGDRVEYNKFA